MGNVAKRAQAKIRAELLSEAPDLRAVYNEYAYQRGLRDVLTQTVKRTAAHEPGWMKRSWLPATLGGGFSYKETSDPWMAAAGFVGGSVLGRMMASPLWQTVSGQLKSRLADAIVDLVSSGNTLRANHLQEVEQIMPISARLVVNQASLKLKRESLRQIIDCFTRAVGSP
jgi:hypothetical protein